MLNERPGTPDPGGRCGVEWVTLVGGGGGARGGVYAVEVPAERGRMHDCALQAVSSWHA